MTATIDRPAPGGTAGSPWPALRAMLRPWRWRIALALLAGAMASACSVALLGTAAWLIATAAGQPPVLTLMVAIVMVRTFGIGRGVLRYSERLLSHDVAFRILGTVRGDLLLGLTARIEAGVPIGRRADLLGRAISDVDDLQEAFLRGLLPWLGAVLVGACAVLTAWLILPVAGIGLLVAVAIGCLVVPVATARAAARREDRRLQLRADRDALVGETVDVVTELVALGALDPTLDRIGVLDRADRSEAAAAARADATGTALAVLLTGAAVCWSLLVGVPAVGGPLSSAYLAVIVLLPLALTEVVAGAAEAVSAAARSRAAADRLAGLLVSDTVTDAVPDTVPDIVSDTAPGIGAGAVGAANPGRVPSVRLRGVCARWPGSDTDVLHDIDLDLPSGTRLGLVGPSGSGKSSLVAVLLGLLPLRCGTLELDGRPVSDPAELRQWFSWADQSAHVFASTIEENVRLARPAASDAEVMEALCRAGLGTWLATLPDGPRTAVGEHGLAVSGGQRQRIALARALLSERPVLVADEITAHLDRPTADAVTDQVLSAAGGRTVVLITHRPADLDLVDAVIELRGGRIVARC